MSTLVTVAVSPRHARRPPLRLAALVWSAASLAPSGAFAAADGPDYWDIVNLTPPDVLNVHVDPTARSAVVAGIPAGTRGLKNLGCTAVPSFQAWMEMAPSERERSSRARWCEISHAGVRGWVSGRFLAEGSPASESPRGGSAGPWIVVCRSGSCAIEQTGLGAVRKTRLRIEPREAHNAEISILRPEMPPQGDLTIFMDGKLISSGPIDTLLPADGRLTMAPDDITAGLISNMKRHRTMTLIFPGEDEGVEFHLEHLGDAFEIATR